MKKVLFFLLYCALLILPLEAEISMKEAVQKGIEINAVYQNHLLESRSIELAKKTALLKKRFNVDSGGAYLFKSQQMEIVLPDMNPAPGVIIPGAGMLAGAKHNYDLKLSLSQPLYTGGILSSAVKLETVRLAVEKNRTRLSQIEIAAEIKTSYFNYRLLQNRLVSLDSLLKQLSLHQERLQNYFREELIKKSDLLETEARIQEQLLNRRDLLNLIEKEKINFKTLCGFDISEVEKNYSEKENAFTRVFAEFKAAHPVLKTLAEQTKGLKIRETMIKGEYMPRVGSFAEIHYGKPGIDFFKNEWSLYFQGGFSISFKIFDWGRLKRQVQIVRYGAEKLENEQADFIKMAEKRFRQLYAAKKSAEEKLETVKKLLQIAAKTMLGRISKFIALIYGIDIFF